MIEHSELTSPSLRMKLRAPRIGFLGIGWIGRHRLQAILEAGRAEIVAVADCDGAAAAEIAARIPGATVVATLESLLEIKPDGVVIATPTGLHADQATRALQSGAAVFCQKPLGRSATETARVVHTARAADRLLGVDMSYRFVRAFKKIKELVHAGEIGDVFAVDAIFHNAYGPDKSWYYDPALSGGGCVIDLGIHLADFALWALDFPVVRKVSSRLFSQGKPVRRSHGALEDYAVARLDLDSGAAVNLACSWRLPAGRDAVIQVTFFGTKGGLTVRNISGSFYDFRAEQFSGTARKVLDDAPDSWGGRAAVRWVERLSENCSYDPAVESAGQIASVIDEIYHGANDVA
jgi:predicted dehydrogenase